MKIRIKNLFGRARSIRMSDTEYERGRLVVESFIRSHPVRDEETYRHSFHLGGAPRILHLLQRPMIAAFLIIIVLAATAGTTLASDQALPGDVLYPIKIHVNENIRAAVTVSAEPKADWAIRRIERRLTEAETLITAGTLDVEEAEYLELHIEEYRSQVESWSEKLETTGNAEAAARIRSRLEASLQGHGELLLGITTSLNESGSGASALILEKVAADTEAASTVRSKTEQGIAEDVAHLEAAAKTQMKVALAAIEDVEESAGELRNVISGGVLVQADSLLKEARIALSSAEERFKARAYTEAFVKAHQAHRYALQARILVRSSARFKENKAEETDENSRETNEERPATTTPQKRIDARIEALKARALELRMRSDERKIDSKNRIEADHEDRGSAADEEIDTNETEETRDASTNTRIDVNVNVQSDSVKATTDVEVEQDSIVSF